MVRFAARLALVVNGGLAAAFLCLWIGNAIRGDFWQADFPAFLVGASIVRAGQGDQLYDHATQKAQQDRLIPERADDPEALLPFNSPPHFAALLLPLAWVDRTTAFLLWTLMQAALVVVVLGHFLHHSPGWTTDERSLAITTFLAFPPLFLTFQLGQLALVGLVALGGFLAALRAGDSRGAGLWLAICTLKPQLAVVPAVILIARRDFRAIGWSLFIFGLAALLATSLCGPHVWIDFLQNLARNARQFGTQGIFPERMYNLKGALTAILGASHADAINAATSAALLASIATTYVVWRRSAVAIDLAAALTFLLGMVVNPHFNPADALCLALPGWLHLDHLRREHRPWLGWAAFLTLCPALFALDNFTLGDWPGRVRPFYFLMLAALAVMTREYLRATRTMPASTSKEELRP